MYRVGISEVFSMDHLRSYTCSKCGGALIVDKDQAIYDCPFCGAKFDVMDFHEEDVLRDGHKALRRMEFHAAEDKFHSILQKDPHDFSALKGLVLCSGKINSDEYIRRVEKLDKCDCEQLRETVSFAEESALPENKEYFVQFRKLLALSDEYQELAKEQSELSTNHKKEARSILSISDRQQRESGIASNRYDSDNPVASILSDDSKYGNPMDDSDTWGGIILVFLAIGGAIFSIYKAGITGLLIFVGIVILIFVIWLLFLSAYRKAKAPHKGKINEISRKIREGNVRLSELNEIYAAEYEKLKELDPTVKLREDMEQNTPSSN